MKDKQVTGIYFHTCINGFTESVDLYEIENYAKNLADVVILGNSNILPVADKNQFISLISEQEIDQVVIAGYTPGMIKSFFSTVMRAAGRDPEKVYLASFGEHGAIKKSDTELAKAILYLTVYGITKDDVLKTKDQPVNDQTLIIGGGIAGIQASLEIANSDHKVFLVERTGTIGGHMAMFDKTFPTLDCAACILTPKMVEVGQHPNIELLTYSELLELKGEPGNYKAIIRKKARKVDLAKCIGCGICSEKCPSKVSSEFDAGTTLRKAIYIPFPQAVPNKYLIDAENCIYVKNGKCGVCDKVCPADAVLLDQVDEVVEIDIGHIILATGFKLFDPKRMENLGYGRFPNVLTALEFERLVNASGPTEGKITQRTKDKKGNPVFTKESPEPGKVALIHCVGSRDENYNKYCSKVCCMYSLKLAHLVKEKLPQAEVYEYYIDMRAFGKGYEEFYERIKNEGIHVIRGKTAKIEQSGEQLLLRSEDIENEMIIEQKVDMVILAVGLEADPETRKLAEKLGLAIDTDGWLTEENYNANPSSTLEPTINLAGVCQGPKDIPDSVAHASAAAASVIRNIMVQKVKSSFRNTELSKVENYSDQFILNK